MDCSCSMRMTVRGFNAEMALSPPSKVKRRALIGHNAKLLCGQLRHTDATLKVPPER